MWEGYKVLFRSLTFIFKDPQNPQTLWFLMFNSFCVSRIAQVLNTPSVSIRHVGRNPLGPSRRFRPVTLRRVRPTPVSTARPHDSFGELRMTPGNRTEESNRRGETGGDRVWKGSFPVSVTRHPVSSTRQCVSCLNGRCG